MSSMLSEPRLGTLASPSPGLRHAHTTGYPTSSIRPLPLDLPLDLPQPLTVVETPSLVSDIACLYRG